MTDRSRTLCTNTHAERKAKAKAEASRAIERTSNHAESLFLGVQGGGLHLWRPTLASAYYLVIMHLSATWLVQAISSLSTTVREMGVAMHARLKTTDAGLVDWAYSGGW